MIGFENLDFAKHRFGTGKRWLLQSSSFPDAQLRTVDAPLGAGPESIRPAGVMDSGLALRAPRSDECGGFSHSKPTFRKTQFLKSNQADFTRPAPSAKIFQFSFHPNQSHLSRHPASLEGRFAIVTDVRRDAVDAEGAADEST